MGHSSARFYFFDLGGRELTDHPLNGSVFAGCGPAIHDGERYHHGWRNVIQVWTRGHERAVTVDDFGGEPVRVKLWAPNPEARETFQLVPAGYFPPS